MPSLGSDRPLYSPSSLWSSSNQQRVHLSSLCTGCCDGRAIRCGIARATPCGCRMFKYHLQTPTNLEEEYVQYHRRFTSSCCIRCCVFGPRLVPLRLAESAWRAAEGF